MAKIFIATPAYDGKVNVNFALALSETNVLLAKNNIEVSTRINVGGSLLVAERNRLVDAFMKSDATHMLCIDSDLAWPPEAVLGLLKHDEEFVAGVYPARGEKSFLFRPCFKEDMSIITSSKNLLKMNYIPAGFMLLKRSAIEKMVAKFPETFCDPKDKSVSSFHCLFNTEVYEGEFWGEDFVFCRRAREAGVDIWVDPMIEFDHAGLRGSLVQVLTNDKEKSAR